jgi:glycosyltransferase involved in cell wall biosynthesis
MIDSFPGRVGLVQRVLPLYRAPFFEALAGACGGGLSIFAGDPRPVEAIEPARAMDQVKRVQAHNIHLLGGRAYLCWQSGLVAWLSDWNPDVLIVEANPRYLSTPRAVAWMHARHRPVIGWGLGVPPAAGRLASVMQAMRKQFISQFDALVTYSQKGAEEYRAGGFPAGRVFVALNAVTGRPAQPPPARPADFAGPPTVLFVGRLQARKRVDNLLHACASLPTALQPRLWVVGDGPALDDFRQVARDVYPQAEFLGARHGPDLDPYFQAADLFVLPGTGGLAVQQAMSFGLPVVVAEADGTQADLVRPENGWLAPANDIPALTAILRSALSSPQKLRQMGAASYNIIAHEINLEQMVSVFRSALQSVYPEK